MPKDSKQKDKCSKQSQDEFDFEVDFEKKCSDNKKTKYALKETLKILNDFVDTHKNNNDCEVKSIKCEKKQNECCDENNCARCFTASKEACDAPVIGELIDTVYTLLPQIAEYNTPYNISYSVPSSATVPTTPTYCKTYSYYVQLTNEACTEVRMTWPLVWMINPLASKVANAYTATLPAGVTNATVGIQITLLLNLLSNKLIKDPAQLTPVLNNGNTNNGPCICDSSAAAQWDYTFNFTLSFAGAAGASGISGTVTNATITLSAPNNPQVLTVLVTPTNSSSTLGAANSTFDLSIPIPSSVGNTQLILLGLTNVESDTTTIDAILEGYGVIPPTGYTSVTFNQNASSPNLIDANFMCSNSCTSVITFDPFPGAIPIASPAHYVSFVPSCEDKCDSFWIATNIETLNV